MNIYTEPEICQAALAREKRKGQTVGFVATMGYLHEGHFSLIQKAKEENDQVVLSIFVNPTQFGPNEDFESYPRNTSRDVERAQALGVDIVFLPTKETMYPTDGGIRILPGPLSNVLCGKSRPTHFDGVLQVILKLFHIVDPDRAYFGQKDIQQLALIETFVRDYNFRTKIVAVPTYREEDGLAKSSRNVHLTKKERLEAPNIYRALQRGKQQLRAGENGEHVKREVEAFINEKTSGTVDYVQLLSYPNLTLPERGTKNFVLACAVHFSKTRLIDNVLIE